ncbi:hypothetical protein EHS89_20960 [Amphritea balenae]|uniref:Uncharacterized protein n=1 Tax=Amphritea balenae TaxID=452629 RepID=A0A3P1SIS1_9GAMM|nr:hypothetical protein [Amphritea balenae]RRC96645.1 hypothetical protein EHS89_20960 [Amphritea balenae]
MAWFLWVVASFLISFIYISWRGLNYDIVIGLIFIGVLFHLTIRMKIFKKISKERKETIYLAMSILMLVFSVTTIFMGLPHIRD